MHQQSDDPFRSGLAPDQIHHAGATSRVGLLRVGRLAIACGIARFCGLSDRQKGRAKPPAEPLWRALVWAAWGADPAHSLRNVGNVGHVTPRGGEMRTPCEVTGPIA